MPPFIIIVLYIFFILPTPSAAKRQGFIFALKTCSDTTCLQLTISKLSLSFETAIMKDNDANSSSDIYSIAIMSLSEA